MAKVYGYCRISTKAQSIERQVRNIATEYPEAVIYKETYTGTKIIGRKEWDKLAKAVNGGDTIVFDSVSRMSRNAAEGFALYQDFFARGVNLVYLKEHQIDTDTYRAAAERQLDTQTSTGDADADEMFTAILDAVNKYILRLAERQIQIAFDQSEKEVMDLRQRTKEGIETARRNGKQIGQRPEAKLTVKKAAPAKAIIEKHSRDFGGELTDAQCITLAGIARGTYYKYKRELLDEHTK